MNRLEISAGPTLLTLVSRKPDQCTTLSMEWNRVRFSARSLGTRLAPEVGAHEYQQLPQNDDNNEDEDHLETDDVPIIGAYTNDYGSMQQ